MKNALLALLLTTTTAMAASGENPGPHTVARTQPVCQSVAVYDRMRGYLDNKSNPAEAARAKPLFYSRTDPDNPENIDSLCAVLRKGTRVTVAKRYGRYECVNWKGQPGPDKPRYVNNNTCFWAIGISSFANVTVPGADLYWDWSGPF